MSDESQRPIIVKRIKKGGGGHHGGAWKIAYADFVTAMMAFFLLMWLLGSTTKGDLKGIADYFQNPLKLSLQGGPGSGSATSPVEGGGKDLTKSTGEVARSSREGKPLTRAQVNVAGGAAAAAAPSTKEQQKAERAKLQELKARIEAVIEASVDLRQFKNQLLLDLTNEGLRIQIVDEQNRPMFDSAASQLKPYARAILRAIAPVLNQVENSISVSGHTDASQYAGGERGFSNWELSADRANACRRELVAGGIDERKIIRVTGQGSIIPLDRNDPFNPINRRISIVVMNKRTSDALLMGGQDLDVDAATVDAEKLIDTANAVPGTPPGK
ncbi:MAG: flagellar motor protein MotB [Rhodocyclaceae bacterium]